MRVPEFPPVPISSVYMVEYAGNRAHHFTHVTPHDTESANTCVVKPLSPSTSTSLTTPATSNKSLRLTSPLYPLIITGTLLYLMFHMSRVTRDLFLHAWLISFSVCLLFHPCYSTYQCVHSYGPHLIYPLIHCIMGLCAHLEWCYQCCREQPLHKFKALFWIPFLWVELLLHIVIPFINWGATALFTVPVLWRETITKTTVIK